MSSNADDQPSPSRKNRLLRPVVLVPAAVVVLAAAITGLALFQPWKLFVDQQVNEGLPVALESSSPTGTADGSDAPAGDGVASPTTAEPTIVASGSFISHEHATTGIAQILQLPDGTKVLRIENLDTSNGPDLKVWLTNAPVIEGVDGWGVFDDGRWLDLGPLKGNQGSQNYVIPADADISDLTSLSIWCDRFNVSFGAAALVAA